MKLPMIFWKKERISTTLGHVRFSSESVSVKDFIQQLLPYGAQWKTHRRLTSNFLSNRQVRSYRHLQDVESKQLLYDLLGSNDFSGEFRRFNLSVIMTLAYGKRLESKMSREIKEFTQIIERYY